MSPDDFNRVTSRSNASVPLEQARNGSALNRTENIKSRMGNDFNMASPMGKDRQHAGKYKTISASYNYFNSCNFSHVIDACSFIATHVEFFRLHDMELMKEKFAKLLLGEDMSGGGKGVSSALALSNAITNLAASAFGEQKRLEPMAVETKARWRKEIDWLLSVTDHIVELVPSRQKAKDGSTMEIMVTKQRNDLLMNIPALRKLDGMLLDCLDNFKDQHEFYYTKSKDDDNSKKGKARNDDKWWIPTPKVPPNGLSDATRKWLQYQKDSVTQVLKAAMAINAQVLTEMEIPENYIEALPKNGRASLGDLIYKSMTEEFFDPDCLLSALDLSTEHKILDLKNRIEASVVIWKRKMNAKDTSLLGVQLSYLSFLIFKDVGHAILESYSRIIESLAFTVLSRIEDVMHADSLARGPSNAEHKRNQTKERPPKEDPEHVNPAETPTSKTLLDFMGWNLDQGETETGKNLKDDADAKHLSKPANIVTNKKISYIEKLENLGGLRSPTARH
ncbi:UNVERIFIED_CONTAM: Rop guanine nucleotide exchange factor 12 [Sesamum radiatum]|uniref:Rop guanine nucleotide exchange factor 12 n=1 Tax=Sesamum radiatum TaxID=300843 RepID=A0AAW2WI80_SESRA